MNPDLLERVAQLVAIPSPSHGEGLLADFVASRLATAPWLEVTRIGDNVVARTDGPGRRVILAGHLDTVPAAGNAEPRIDGDVLWGLGSADMKGGLALMLALAEGDRPPVELSLVFYVAEEVARRHNGLLEIERTRPDLLEGDVAILGEPTAARVEAGCQGVLKAEVVLAGVRSHAARPWMGDNAVHRAAPVLASVAAWPGRTPGIDGCAYREALQVVRITGGVADNVVPDEVRLMVNHRFAPDRTGAEAMAWLEGYLAPALDPGRDRLELVEVAPSAPPGLLDPTLAALVTASGAAPRAKLGWTDVAFFAERGVPAANFGPGDPELAHTAGERVTRAELEAAHAALCHVLFSFPAPPA